MLEGGDGHADPDDGVETTAGGVPEIAEDGLVSAVERAGDLGDLGFGVGVWGETGECAGGVGGAAGGDKVARGLGDEKEADEEGGGGEEFDPEHPLPGLETQEPNGAGAAGELGDDEVAQERGEETEDDGELLQGREASANGGGGDFGDVGGADHAGGADGETADEAIDDKLNRTAGDARTPGAEGEEDGGTEERGAAAEGVGDAAGEESARSAAEEHGSDIETGDGGAGAKGGGERADGAVDDAAVETEEETADGGDGGGQKDGTKRGRGTHAGEGGGGGAASMAAGDGKVQGCRE